MLRILVPGKTGQVGWELQGTLAPLGTVIALDRSAMDLANPDSIRRAIRDAKPEIIVNAAGYTMVDKAESEAIQRCWSTASRRASWPRRQNASARC